MNARRIKYITRSVYAGQGLKKWGQGFVVRTKKQPWVFPKKIGISQFSFLSRLFFLAQHRCIALSYTTILFFVVQAEVFHGIIVASHSCTEYHWGTLIVLY